MSWQNDRAELLEAIAVVVLCAPDQFPKYDHEQEPMSLERAFKELEDRFQRVAKGAGEPAIVGSCRQMLYESLFHYREGRVQEGAWRLQDMEQLFSQL